MKEKRRPAESGCIVRIVAVVHCGELFEQALYAQNELTPTENNEFTELVENIVNHEQPPSNVPDLVKQ
jgi:hypothetical protein